MLCNHVTYLYTNRQKKKLLFDLSPCLTTPRRIQIIDAFPSASLLLAPVMKGLQSHWDKMKTAVWSVKNQPWIVDTYRICTGKTGTILEHMYCIYTLWIPTSLEIDMREPAVHTDFTGSVTVWWFSPTVPVRAVGGWYWRDMERNWEKEREGWRSATKLLQQNICSWPFMSTSTAVATDRLFFWVRLIVFKDDLEKIPTRCLALAWLCFWKWEVTSFESSLFFCIYNCSGLCIFLLHTECPLPLTWDVSMWQFLFKTIIHVSDCYSSLNVNILFYSF